MLVLVFINFLLFSVCSWESIQALITGVFSSKVVCKWPCVCVRNNLILALFGFRACRSEIKLVLSLMTGCSQHFTSKPTCVDESGAFGVRASG